MKNKDRISDLPDSIIHHILSFLPSTKQAIRTSVLSKQWTNLPFLIFDLSGKPNSSDEHHISIICRSMDNTLLLHECSKLNQIGITLHSILILFLNSVFQLEKRWMEYLELCFNWSDHNSCSFFPNGCVNWECLKDLYIDCCSFSNQAIDSVVSGSPLLESLEIHYCQGFDLLTIASNSLKILVLEDLNERFMCPNLVEFLGGGCLSNFSDGAIDVLCVNTLHELLELNNSRGLSYFFIDSNSLKKLVLVNTGVVDAVGISCPNLEELSLSTLPIETIKLVNIPSSVYATLGFHCNYATDDDLVRMVLEQLHHVKELNIACCFIRILTAREMRCVSSPSINSKCLTLECGCKFVEILPGIAYAFRTSPELEKLVINLGWFPCRCGTTFSEENYVWNSKRVVFKCLVSHLKIVEVSGLSGKREEELEAVLNFVEYLLKNAKVLEKMVIKLKDRRADVFEISQKLSSFSRCSQHAIVELC